MGTFNRRDFIKTVGVATAGLVFKDLLSLNVLEAVQDPMKQYDYKGWEDFYRNQWTWDKKTRGTHGASCTGSCPHYVYSKNGVVIREEQSGDMPLFPNIPENNPRGCQKGECAVDYIYAPHRIKYPLIRTGKRGEGKWRRASWDEALGMIADKVVDTIKDHAPDCISVYTPAAPAGTVAFCAGHRFAHFIGAHTHTFYDWYSDHPIGHTQTLGVQSDSCECADWYNARYIIQWGANTNQTRIPDAHFINEAALNGTKIVSIAPDYNTSSIKADLWIHPKPGTDAKLALGMAHIIINEKLYDEAYLKEQTDMPFLIRSDNKQFLRESDMVEGGSDSKFYSWSRKTNNAVLMKGCWGEEPPVKPPIEPPFLGRNTLTFPKDYLKLGDLDPALEGSFSVKTKDGKVVTVRPVFDVYKEKIMKDYTPEKVSKTTGVSVQVLTKVARGYATAKPAMIITGGGTNHWFYSDVIMRSLLFLAALSGNTGKHGGGVNHYVGQWKPVHLPGVAALSFPKGNAKHRFGQTTIWSYVHGEINDGMKNTALDVRKYLKESLETNQMPLYPKGGKDPKVFIVYRGNYLNQAKGISDILKNLWPKLDLIVTLNFRMDSQALFSDIVLPSTHWFEKTELNSTMEHTFIHMIEPATKPLWESKSDWKIFQMLSKKVEEAAAKKGFTKFNDEQFGWERDLSTLHAQMTDNGKLIEDSAAAQFILDKAPQTKGITLDLIKEKGPQRFKANWTAPIKEGIPYTPFMNYVVDKKPWPTLTGRQQFYIDHKWFMDLGVELPLHKEPLDVDKYPLWFNTLHGRYGMHSTWKDNALMLRLHRGGPIAYLSPDEAKKRGLKDNDWIEIFNAHGKVVCRVKIFAGEQNGRISMPFTPELYTDLIEGSSQSPLPIRITPTHLVGNYGHLRFRPNYYGPGGHQRDARVEVKKYTGPTV
ncbi:MAG: molybdopterin-dependent oxidoreductase [Dissulfurispiraceae bacterium]|jgi:complex iron-sulfur molybdoenzyme family reductase subunit alpha|nr:molybdopterin-dependent oxidoreductase [Dissulfurispiraceae bacterium]